MALIYDIICFGLRFNATKFDWNIIYLVQVDGCRELIHVCGVLLIVNVIYLFEHTIP